MSNLASLAFLLLYPKEDISSYTFTISYSRRFSSYNANVKYFNRQKKYHFNVSYLWKSAPDEVVIGLLQYLLIKCCKHLNPEKKITVNTELYHQYLKTVHSHVSKTICDPVLKEHFDILNASFFNNELECPNLKWGTFSKRTLGHYSYGSDTITMSLIFKDIADKDIDFLRFVLYHEMLHKKHKFYTTKEGRGMHHHRNFREEERKYPGYKEIDAKLPSFIRRQSIKNCFKTFKKRS